MEAGETPLGENLWTRMQKKKALLMIPYGLFVLGALIAFLPVGLFAMQQPGLFNARTETVSVFSQMNSPSPLPSSVRVPATR